MPAAELPSDVTYAKQYRRCGKPDCAVCAAGAAGHGPYWYAFWRDKGRRRSRYLGKQAPAGALDVADPTPASPVVPRAALRVRTLGGFAAWRGEELIPPERWSRRKVAHLFKLLLSAPEQRLHREQIVDVLWPEADAEEGAHNLRSAVHLLRKILDSPTAAGNDPSWSSYLRSDGDALELLPASAGRAAPDWLDAAAFAQASAAALRAQDAAACRAALALYGGDYLPDEVYEDWAAARREELRRQYLAVLLHLADVSAMEGALTEAEDSLRKVLAADPCHEAAAQQLMSLLAAQGRYGEALRVYAALATALRADLGLAPAPETSALHARLLRRQAAPRAAGLAPNAVTERRPTNLPAPVSSFIGREQEQATVRDLLAGHRLVTLTGVGGCGKTRLALQLALSLVPTYPQGVWLVELAGLPAGTAMNPSFIVPAVARALGVPEEQGRPLLDVLLDFLQPRHLLLLLDNCEHLIAAGAALSAMLLRACPRVQILTTSREALRIDGEMAWRVPPLALPPSAYQPRLEELPRCEAVQLFMQRAQLVQPDFRLTEENAAAVVQVCRRLDGIPLAIELAASRLGVLSVDALAAKLDDCFRVLVGGSRTALPRQQTLRATLDWSYALLDEPERAVLRRLAVFAGGGTLPAAEALSAGEHVAAGDVLDLLSRLVSKSLVMVAERDGETRYRLLETVRQYAWDQLAVAGETDAVRAHHLAWYAELAAQAEPALRGAQQVTWLAQLEREHDNLRAALRWGLQEGGDTTLGVALAGRLWLFWGQHGHLTEGRRWLVAALHHGEHVPAVLRAKALTAAGLMAANQSDFVQAIARVEEGLRLAREAGDRPGTAFALGNLAWMVAYQGDGARSRLLLEQVVALHREMDNKQSLAAALCYLGAGMVVDDGAKAASLLAEALALADELGDKRIGTSARGDLARLALQQGDVEKTKALSEEALTLARALGDKQQSAALLIGLGFVASLQGEQQQARALVQEAIGLRRDLDTVHRHSDWLMVLAHIALAEGHPKQAARLYGAAEAVPERLGVAFDPVSVFGPHHDAAVAAMRAKLGDDALARAWAAGKALSPHQIEALIVEEGSPARR